MVYGTNGLMERLLIRNYWTPPSLEAALLTFKENEKRAKSDQIDNRALFSLNETQR